MNIFLKNAGTIVLLIGALWLIIPFFSGCQSNATLLTGLILVVFGFVLYVVLNKKLGFRK
jgi:thiol:disulfide interchange protein